MSLRWRVRFGRETQIEVRVPTKQLLLKMRAAYSKGPQTPHGLRRVLKTNHKNLIYSRFRFLTKAIRQRVLQRIGPLATHRGGLTAAGWSLTAAGRSLGRSLTAAGRSLTARSTWVVVAPIHAGFGLTVEQGVLSVAVCHSVVRGAANVGDLVLVVSPQPSQRTAPKEYREALCKLSRNSRVVVAGFRVAMGVAVRDYQAGRWRRRRDSLYRVAREGERACWKDASGQRWVKKTRAPHKLIEVLGHRMGDRDLRGQVLLGTRYFRSAVDLSAAPPIPPTLKNTMSSWGGRCCKKVVGATSRNLNAWFDRRLRKFDLE